MKPGMQPFFRALDMPFVLCAIASLRDSVAFQVSLRADVGCECGEQDGRNGPIASVAVISFLAFLKSC